MKVKFKGVQGTWRDVADSARTTIGMEEGTGDPKDSWKKKMLLAEHSPIRLMQFKWKWYDLKSWVSVHFVRHWLGIIHFVRTQRNDRTNIELDRNKATQDTPVEHEVQANAQALINISRKRLCRLASKETREAWQEVKAEIEVYEPVIASVMVEECIYRGFCPELECCGYDSTKSYRERLEEYRSKKV